MEAERWPESEVVLTDCLAHADELWGPAAENTLVLFDRLGFTLERLGRRDQMIELTREGLRRISDSASDVAHLAVRMNDRLEAALRE